MKKQDQRKVLVALDGSNQSLEAVSYVGRRGLSKTKEFLMGRVSKKVIHIAKNHAFWVVN